MINESKLNTYIKLFLSVFLAAYLLLPIYSFRTIFVLIPMDYFSFMIFWMFFHLSVSIAGISTISYVGFRALYSKVGSDRAGGFKIGVCTRVFIAVFLVVFLSALFFEVVLSRFYYEHPLIDLSLERSYYSMLNFAATFYAAAFLAGLSALLLKGYFTVKEWREK